MLRCCAGPDGERLDESTIEEFEDCGGRAILKPGR